jgi:thiol-disulfide isomerase/thioredoxin
MEPVLAQVEKEYGEQVDFKSYNVMEERGKADKYAISAVPTCLFINADGKIVDKVVGQQNLAGMRNYLDNLVSPSK